MGLKCRDGPAHGKYSWKRSHKRTISFPLAKSRKEQKHYQGFCSCFSWCRDPRLWDPTPYKHSRSSIGRGSWWDTEILDGCITHAIGDEPFLQQNAHSQALTCSRPSRCWLPRWIGAPRPLVAMVASTRPRHRVLWPMRTRGDRSTRGRHRRTGGGEMHGKKGSVGLTIIKVCICRNN